MYPIQYIRNYVCKRLAIIRDNVFHPSRQDNKNYSFKGVCAWNYGTFFFAGWTIFSGANKSITPCTFFVCLSMLNLKIRYRGGGRTLTIRIPADEYLFHQKKFCLASENIRGWGGISLNRSIVTLRLSFLLRKVGWVRDTSKTVSLTSTCSKSIQVSLLAVWWEGSVLISFSESSFSSPRTKYTSALFSSCISAFQSPISILSL